MRITRIGSNMVEMKTGRLKFLFSYITPVAYVNEANNRYKVTEEKFSKSTTRHIYKWLDGITNYEIVKQSSIQSMVDKQTDFQGRHYSNAEIVGLATSKGKEK